MALHTQIDARSLEAHRLMAERVERDPALRALALATVNRWMATESASAPYLVKWRDLLQGDLQELLEVMRSESEGATALRQCSPFGGTAFISHRKRYQLIRKYAGSLTVDDPTKSLILSRVDRMTREAAAD